MKILSSFQIKECDSATIEKGISSISLMEMPLKNAQIGLWIILNQIKSFSIFCGNGNNAEAMDSQLQGCFTRKDLMSLFLLMENNFVFSEDAKINLNKIKAISGITIKDYSEFDNRDNSVIIDALFGYGLNRELSDDFKT